MSGALAVAIFAACAVEAVEALTIVLAVGFARGWRWTLTGAAGAVVALGVIVAALGPALDALPLDVLRVAVGVVLLTVGAQWLRKAVLRAAGRKALHDERAIYRDATHAAGVAPARRGVDAYALTTAGGAVLVEGAEVVMIVLSFAAGGHGLAVGVVAAALAVGVVVVAGVALRAPLARVPENTLKLAVAVMLVSLGVFWTVEGAGLGMSEALLPVIVGAVLCVALLAARGLRLTGSPAP
jgi:uncharacterized membrane protein